VVSIRDWGKGLRVFYKYAKTGEISPLSCLIIYFMLIVRKSLSAVVSLMNINCQTLLCISKVLIKNINYISYIKCPGRRVRCRILSDLLRSDHSTEIWAVLLLHIIYIKSSVHITNTLLENVWNFFCMIYTEKRPQVGTSINCLIIIVGFILIAHILSIRKKERKKERKKMII
jgi:uncharacterized membrane protein